MMKHRFFFVGMVACMLMNSCSKDGFQGDNGNEPIEVSTVDVTVHTAFSMSEGAWSATRAVTAADAAISRIVLSVFDTGGNKVKEFAQRQGDSDFGDFSSFRLPMGTYQFVAVAHMTASTDKGNVQISSPTLAIIPDAPLGNTFACVQQVTVAGYQTQDVTLDLKLCVTDLMIKAMDVIPSDVKNVELVVNSGQQEATTLAFNPTTGLFNGNHSFSRTWDASTAAGKAGASFSVIAFLEAYPKVVSAVIRAYDAEGEKLYERTFDNLTLKRATKLVVSTNLFTGSIAPSLSFEEWSVENVAKP